jgi:hypothetical protein
MRSADQALVMILTAAGYDQNETRQVLRAVRAAFTQEIATLLSAEKMKDFAGFTQWLQLDTDDARLYASLAAHLEQQRSDLEDKPALDVEPFSIESVYIEPECGVLPWKAVHGSEDELFEELPKPFDESSAPREDLMASVLRLVHDLQYRDWIVLMGPPGAGKSTFTKKLCVGLGQNGFIPIRVPLQHLRVDMDLFDAIRDTLVRFGGEQGLDFEADLFREKVYSERVPISTGEMSPYIFIFDGWDEINLAADEGFQRRVDRLFASIRRNLTDQNRNLIRVIITGRPSAAIARSGSLREHTRILVIRPIRPDALKAYVRRLQAALEHPIFSGPDIETWTLGSVERYDPVLSLYEEEFP